MRIMFAILLFLTAVNGLEKNFHIAQNNSFDLCYLRIANKYLKHHTNIFINPKLRNPTFSHPVVIKYNHSLKVLSKTVQELAGSYTIFYDNVDELNTTLEEIGKLNRVYYIIVAKQKADLQQISENLWQFRLYKSVILLPYKSKTKIYVIDLKNSKCGNYIRPKKINECLFGKFQKDLSLFSPDMRKDFYKCPIRVIWSPYLPWMSDPNSTEVGIYKDILRIFEERSHFRIIYLPESDQYTEDLAFYNFKSIIADLSMEYADVFVGLVSFTVSPSYAWSTGAIYDDNIYLVVPNPKMIPYWKSIFKLFLPSTWVCLVLMIVSLSVIFTLLAYTTVVDKPRFTNVINNMFYIYTISISVGFHKVPQSYKLRIYLGAYLINAIILTAISQGKYFSFISSPLHEKRITNLEQLLESDVPVKTSEGLRLLFLFPLGDEENDRLLKRMDVLPSNDLSVNLKRAYYENFATLTDKGLLIMNPYLHNAMQVSKIFSFLTCFLVQKNFVLYENILKNLTTIVEAGFVDKFVSLVRFQQSRHQYFVEENRVMRLTLAHVEGPFVVLVAGQTVASFCLIVEYIYFLYMTYRKRKRLQITN